MRKLFIAAFLTMMCGTAMAQTGKYVINGRINGQYNADKVYLVAEEYINGPETVVDSSMVVNGTYKFEGKVPAQTKMYFIKSADPDSRSTLTPVFIEEGTINITVTGDQFTHGAKVRGTVNNDILTFYFSEIRHINDSILMATDIDWKINGHEMEREEIEFPRRSKLTEKRWLDIQREMVTTYNKYVFAPFMIYWEMRRDLSTAELKALRDQLDPALLDHPYTQMLNDYMTSTEFTVGNQMPDFELPRPDGQTVKWKEFRGKYVLIDFWASWCGPCMREVPNLVKLYEETKGDKFEIVGISLDRDKDKWLAAVEQNKMSWTQLCDFKMWDTQPAKLCNVDAVPFTILVDPQGDVIAIDLRGEELAAKIKEVLNK